MTKGRFIYLAEVDISIDNGRGINEREFVRVLRRDYPDEVICVLPKPRHPEKFYDPGIEYVAPHSGNPAPYAVHLVSAFRRVRRIHARRPVDGLIIRMGVVPVVPYLASRLLGIPLIYKTLAPYNLVPGGPAAGQGFHRRVSRMFDSMFRTTIREAVASDTVSEALAELLRESFDVSAERLKVIPNGANVEVFSPGDREDARRRLGLGRFSTIIGYVGAIDPARHLDLLVRAVAGLSDRRDATLVVVGGGPSRHALEELAGRLGVGERVVFVGSVPYGEVPIYMRAFDVGVDLTMLPIPVDGYVCQASFSQKIAQYLGCGLPVLAWDIPDNQAVAEAGVGAVARFGDVDDLVSALDRLLPADRAEARRRSERAVEYVRQNLAYPALVARRVEWWRSIATGASSSRSL